MLTDISTNFERVSDHCSNIAVYQIQVPKDEYDTHEYLQNVKHQEHAEFDREEMAYKSGIACRTWPKCRQLRPENKKMIYICRDDRNIQKSSFALKNSGYQAVGFETAKDFTRLFRKAAGPDSAGYHAAR